MFIELPYEPHGVQACRCIMVVYCAMYFAIFVLRLKMGNNQSESVLVPQLDQNIALEFEKAEPAQKLRLLLCELIFVMSQV